MTVSIIANSMIRMMLIKFMLNDVPHAVGLTSPRDAEIVRLYKEGLPLRDISKRLNVSLATVSNTMVRSRIREPELKRRKTSEEAREQAERVVQLYSEGIRPRDIARKLGIDQGRVNSIISTYRATHEDYPRRIGGSYSVGTRGKAEAQRRFLATLESTHELGGSS